MRSTWVILTKLSPPHQQVPLVERTRSSMHVESGALPQIALLQAPAGYGKTTLMAQWHAAAKASGRGVGWVSLDDRDRDPATLLPYIALALGHAGVAIGSLEPATPDELLSVPPDALLRMLTAAVAAHERPATLFLDDVRMDDSEVLRCIGRLTEQLSAAINIVIAGREALDGLFLKQRSRGLLRVLDASDLRFDPADARQLLPEKFSDAAVQKLVALTEGWPMAIQLARLSDIAFLSDARTSGLTAAVCEQVIRSLDADIQRVVALTALFDRISPDLLNAVLERNDGAQILRRLTLESALIVPMDRETPWYRHHSLFRDYLRTLLGERSRQEVNEFRRRAALWFLQRGLLNEAFQHAHATGDSDFIADIAETAGGWRLALSGGRMAIRTLAGLPSADGKRYPRLRLAQIYAWAQDGLVTDCRKAFEALRRDTQDFTRGRYGVEDAALVAESGIVDTVLRIYEDWPLSPEAVTDLEHRLSFATHIDAGVASAASNLACYAYFDIGEYQRCLQSAEVTLASGRAAGSLYAEVYLRIYMAQASFRLGRVLEAQTQATRARELAERRFGADSNQACIARILLAQFELELGDVAAARGELGDRLPIVLQRDGWFDVFFSALETQLRLAVLERDWSAADEVIEIASRTAQLRGLPRLQALAHIFRAEARARLGSIEAAQREIDAARTLLGWSVESTPAPRDRRLAEALALASLRCSLAAGRYRDVISGVEKQLAQAHTKDHPREALRLQLLRELAVRAAGNPTEARRAVQRLLAVTENAQFAGSIGWELAEHAAEMMPLGDATQHIVALAARTPPPAALRRGEAPAISPRELEILQSLAQGLSNKEIARQMAIAESTVKTHRERLYQKLGVSTRSGALTAARSLGILPSV